MAETNWEKVNEDKRDQILFGQAVNLVVAKYDLKYIRQNEGEVIDSIRALYGLIQSAHEATFKAQKKPKNLLF